MVHLAKQQAVEGELPTSLEFVSELRWRLQSGWPFTSAVESSFQTCKSADLRSLQQWWTAKLHNLSLTTFDRNVQRPAQRVLMHVLSMGLLGVPLVQRLSDLESQFHQQASADLQRFYQKLPFQAMIPLLALQMPAFLLLLFVWWVREMEKML